MAEEGSTDRVVLSRVHPADPPAPPSPAGYACCSPNAHTASGSVEAEGARTKGHDGVQLGCLAALEAVSKGKTGWAEYGQRR